MLKFIHFHNKEPKKYFKSHHRWLQPCFQISVYSHGFENLQDTQCCVSTGSNTPTTRHCGLCTMQPHMHTMSYFFSQAQQQT